MRRLPIIRRNTGETPPFYPAIMTASIVVTPMTAAHADAVLRIYQHGIDEGDATFETKAPTWDVFDAGKLPEHRFVALDGAGVGTPALAAPSPTGSSIADPNPASPDHAASDHADPSHVGANPAVLGYVVVSSISKRSCYAGVVELSVYVAPEARGRGVGSRLLSELIASTEAAGIWTINAGIFPENTASLALHQRHGFRVIGRQERIGRTIAGVWRDVLLLERRSPIVM